MIQIYYADLEESGIESSREIEKLLPYLSMKRREKIQNYRFLDDRLLAMYGGLLVRECIGEVSGRNPKDLHFEIGEYGKPYCRNEAVSFSLSHTKNMVCCAVSTNESVGIDVERIGAASVDVLSQVCQESERKLVDESKDMETMFYMCWTRKEAYGKYTGKGLLEQLEHTVCMTPESRPCIVKTDRVISGLDESICQKKQIVGYDKSWILGAYVMSLCSRRQSEVILVKKTREEIIESMRRGGK